MGHVEMYCVEKDGVIYRCFEWEWVAYVYIKYKKLDGARIVKYKMIRRGLWV